MPFTTSSKMVSSYHVPLDSLNPLINYDYSTMSKQLTVLLFLGSLGSLSAQSITIANNSFEQGTLPLNIGLGPYSNVLSPSIVQTGGALPNWTAAGTTNNGSAGAYSPTTNTPWWDGKNIGYIYVYAPGAVSLSQTLSATLQNNTTYTLSAVIGQFPTYLFNYALQLWAGNTLLATSSKLVGTSSFVSATDMATYSSGSNNSQAGQPLTIVIAVTGTAQGNSGVFFDSISLTASSVTTVAAVVSASSFGTFSSASPGSWIEVYGANLAGDARSWALADFNGNNAPVSLDGSKVTIGGKSAFIDYISPGQINALISSDTPTGLQQLTVTSPSGTSSAYSITVNPVEPGLLAPPNFKIAQYPICSSGLSRWRVCATPRSDTGRRFESGQARRYRHALRRRARAGHAFRAGGSARTAGQFAGNAPGNVDRRSFRYVRLRWARPRLYGPLPDQSRHTLWASWQCRAYLHAWRDGGNSDAVSADWQLEH
jgi:HpiC1 cyclase